MRIETVDYHTAGEPFRIVTGGVDPLPGRTILDKRRHALEHADDVRRLLVNEPRGHADMYGCFVTEPEDEGADIGVVFFHNAGYSTACGHGTIALVTWAVESGVVSVVEPETRVVVDCPREGWRRCAVEDGDVSRALRNVPAYVHARGLESPGAPSTSHSGGVLRFLEERSLPEELPRLIELGRRSRPPRRDQRSSIHRNRNSVASTRRLLATRGRRPAACAAKRHGVRRRRGRSLTLRQRDIGANGAAGRPELRHLSVIGTEFRAWIVDRTDLDGRPRSSPRSKARPTTRAPMSSCSSPGDDLGTGFLLR